MQQVSVGVRLGFLRANVFLEEYMILHHISFQALNFTFHTLINTPAVFFFLFNETLFFDDSKNLTDGSVTFLWLIKYLLSIPLALRIKIARSPGNDIG